MNKRPIKEDGHNVYLTLSGEGIVGWKTEKEVIPSSDIP